MKGYRYLLSILILLIGTGFFIPEQGETRGSCSCPSEVIIKPGPDNLAYVEDIKEIQLILRNYGLYKGRCDGDFDDETAHALKAYQRMHRLRETGHIDAATWEVIGRTARSQLVTMKPPTDNMRVVVDTRNLSLTILVDGQSFKEFPVAIGKRETPTPIGDWKVVSKGKWSGGFGTRWLGLNVPYGMFGIHGTNKPWSIGRTESHGCVRMFNRDVETVFKWVPVGTPVHIIGDPFAGRRLLLRGEKGSDVFFLQKRLIQLGFLQSKPDGIYGYGTERAVIRFQTQMKMRRTGQVGHREYRRLRLITNE